MSRSLNSKRSLNSADHKDSRPSVPSAYNDDVAAGQLAVFQGASEVPISDPYGPSEQRRGKTANWPRPVGVAFKMGRRLRCSSVTYRLRYAPSSRLAGVP